MGIKYLLPFLRNLAYLLLFTGQQIHAQQVSNINAKPEGTLIRISFDLTGTSPAQRFNIAAYYSLDGGKDWQSMSSIKGDIHEINGGYGKELSWDVLADRDQLTGQDISFKIFADIIGKVESDQNVIKQADRKLPNSKKFTWGILSAAGFGVSAGFLINSNSLNKQYQTATDQATTLHEKIVISDRLGYVAAGIGAIALIRLLTLIPNKKSSSFPLAMALISNADYTGVGLQLQIVR